jgi:hypothetical protein
MAGMAGAADKPDLAYPFSFATFSAPGPLGPALFRPASGTQNHRRCFSPGILG